MGLEHRWFTTVLLFNKESYFVNYVGEVSSYNNEQLIITLYHILKPFFVVGNLVYAHFGLISSRSRMISIDTNSIKTLNNINVVMHTNPGQILKQINIPLNVDKTSTFLVRFQNNRILFPK